MLRIFMATFLLGFVVGSANSQTLILTVDIDEVEVKNGSVARLRLTCKAAGVSNTPFRITPKSEFIFNDGTDSRKLTARTVLTDSAAKEHFVKGNKARASLKVDILNRIEFGPGVFKNTTKKPSDNTPPKKEKEPTKEEKKLTKTEALRNALTSLVDVLSQTRPGRSNANEWAAIRNVTLRMKPHVKKNPKGVVTALLSTLARISPGRDNKTEWTTIRAACITLYRSKKSTGDKLIGLMTVLSKIEPKRDNTEEWALIRKVTEAELQKVANSTTE